ncbi:hypothetical protein RIF29_37768 [Crotalaria pallida]|uniref:Reverse transcriptase zinc-binding domain-containing protein n=1 Tax=Crotalaria pallida TaxID=3830 RepID=A0AAN9HNB0_CROPI
MGEVHHRIGNGNSSFCHTDWTGHGYLSQAVPFIDIHDFELTIKQVWQYDNWNLSCIYSWLPHHAIQEINGIKPHFHDSVVDCFVWKSETDSVYIAKSGFRWLSNLSTNDIVADQWSWIWKLPTSENIRFFISLIYHDSLTTNVLRFRRKVTSSPLCLRCGLHHKTILRCLRDRHNALHVWYVVGLEQMPNFFPSDIKSWIKDSNSHKGNLFMSTPRWNWRARNSHCLSFETMTMHHILTMIYNDIKCLKMVYLPSSRQLHNQRLV